MTAVLLTIITGLIVSEFSAVCPWAARKLVRWSAHRRYVPRAYAELRAEEYAAYIDDRPGKLFKLLTALGFAAAAVVTRKVAPAVAPPDPLWWPTTTTVPVHYDDREWTDDPEHPKARAVHQAWNQLTDEVRDAAKEVGVSSRSWRRCIKELRRITGDERWTLVVKNLDLLEEINNSNAKARTTSKVLVDGPVIDIHTLPVVVSVTRYSFPTYSTIADYQAAVETARADICRLASDFLLSSASR